MKRAIFFVVCALALCACETIGVDSDWTRSLYNTQRLDFVDMGDSPPSGV